MSEKVDYLDEDPVISSQKYCVISVLTPKNFKDVDDKSSMYTFKVRGAYETVEEAQKRIQFLNSIDPNVNIYLAEVGKWCPFDDDPEKAKDAVYKDEELNRLMKGYKENQEKAKEHFQQRKAEMVAKALTDTKEKKEKLKAEEDERKKLLKKVIADDSTAEKVEAIKVEDSLQEKEKQLKEKENKVLEGKKEIEQKKGEIHNKEDKIRKLNDEMNAAKKKYEDMLAKVNKTV
jgi:DNA repair exonuclease SbcCD ATPase subunit